MDWVDGHSKLVTDDDSVNMRQRSDAEIRTHIDTEAHFPRQIAILHDYQKWNQIFVEKVAHVSNRYSVNSESMYIRDKHPLSALAFFGGCAMVLTNIYELFLEIFHFNVLKIFTSAYLLVFGLTICIIEGNEKLYLFSSSSLFEVILTYAKFLKHVLGRGSFYFIVGTMQASKKSWIDLTLGVYFIFLGFTLIFILVALTASKNHSFTALPSSIDEIHELFQTHDKNKDGFLDYDEFGNILKSWGVVLSADDLEIACYAVDQDGDEKISEQELLDWWESVQNFNSENYSPIV